MLQIGSQNLLVLFAFRFKPNYITINVQIIFPLIPNNFTAPIKYLQNSEIL